MKTPNNEVKIIGNNYKINKDSVFTHRLGYFGTIDYTKSELIFSNNKLVQSDRLNQAFIHEVIHGIDHQLDIFPNDIDEKIIRRLSSCIYTVLTENNLCINHKQIPERINFFGVEYNIEWVDELQDSLNKKPFHVDNLLTTIRIDNSDGVSLETKKSIFILTIMLVIEYMFHIFDMFDDVTAIDVFSNAFYKVLIDNKDLCFCES